MTGAEFKHTLDHWSPDQSQSTRHQGLIDGQNLSGPIRKST